MALSIVQTFSYARGYGGLSPEDSVTAVAVAMAESGLNPRAMGDEQLVDATYGPSVGLWQIRSLKAQSGTGQPRDATRLKDPMFNARSMGSISGGGHDWSAWSTYKNGAYLSHVGAVRSTVAAAIPGLLDGSGGGVAPTAGGTSPAGDYDPFPGGDGLPGYGDDLLRGLGGGLSGVTGDVLDAVAKTMLFTAACALGVVLVVVGLGRAAS